MLTGRTVGRTTSPGTMSRFYPVCDSKKKEVGYYPKIKVSYYHRWLLSQKLIESELLSWVFVSNTQFSVIPVLT